MGSKTDADDRRTDPELRHVAPEIAERIQQGLDTTPISTITRFDDTEYKVEMPLNGGVGDMLTMDHEEA